MNAVHVAQNWMSDVRMSMHTMLADFRFWKVLCA